ncbi:MAG: UDP-N-acetylmuramoyl-L-alanyl-D-glutamate--2,6-diaminopimelate ligase [Gammaproteobacteria bacterium]
MSAIASAMRLSELLDGFHAVPVEDDCTVSDLALDSRAVGAGCCFVALRGSRDDGMRFAGDAVARGAVAILTEQVDARAPGGVPIIHVSGLRQHLGALANRLYDTPSASVRVFAVTGTNGKTTVAHLAAQALVLLDGQAGYIGTLGAGPLDALEPNPNTTPDVITINRWLARLRARGARAATLEASSHALDQGRLDGVRIRGAAFTNLGRDHLDYHGDMAGYGAAKRRLFELPDVDAAVINVDDPFGAGLATALAPRLPLVTTSSGHGHGAQRGQADLVARAIELDATGLRFELVDGDARVPVASRLIGRFNVDNLLVIAGLLVTAGHELPIIGATLGRLEAVTGRLEHCVESASGAAVFIDYAHTPESLAAVLATLRELAPRRLHVVFGCGGDRDRGKRPLMGACAEGGADVVVVTSDNPRSERTADIAAEILAGMREPVRARVIEDRAEAIHQAIAAAGAGDIVLVAGKGHETTQELGGRLQPFSDREQVRRACQGGGR